MKYNNLLDTIRGILFQGDSTVGNPTTAMKKTVLLQGGSKRVSPIWRNIRPVPDVSSFKICARTLDQLLIKFGLARKVGGTIEVTRYQNRDINRYIEHQLIRMSRADEKLYWRIALSLISRSKCFFIIALNHVYPRWYKTMPWKAMPRLYLTFLRRVKHQWLNGTTFWSMQSKIRMARVYIDKADGKKRPLGVPSPSWRIYLHMWASLLTWRYDKFLSDCQHGFRPGRGTKTAWEAIANSVLSAPNIYEYDLVKFFDRVNIINVSTVLESFGCPPTIVAYLEDLCRYSYPKLQTEDMADESSAHYKAANDGLGGATPYSNEGVPQGAAISPFLASLALENSLFSLGNGCVQYADDGLFYGENINTNLTDSRFTERVEQWVYDDTYEPNTQEWFDSLGLKGKPEDYGIEINNEYLGKRVVIESVVHPDFNPFKGIEFHPNKSGWVKKDGVWLKPLKFLGIVYDGREDTLYSDTKTGKRLYFDKDRLLDELVNEDLGDPVSLSGEKTLTKRESFEHMIQSRFWGFLQSRLYNGSWNQEEFWQNLHLIANGGSWMGKACKDGWGAINLLNASSVASRSLLTFLRTLDGDRRREKWARRPIRLDMPEKPTPSSKQDDQAPIRWVMRAEWKRAYNSSTFAGFESWMTHYISRMDAHSVYTIDQMYTHYGLCYFAKRLTLLEEAWRDVSYEAHVLRIGGVTDPVRWTSLRYKLIPLRDLSNQINLDLGQFEVTVQNHLSTGKCCKKCARRPTCTISS